MKKILLLLGAISAILTNSYGFLGVGDVVFDPAAVAKAVEQIKLMKQQIKASRETLVANTGVKDSVSLYNDLRQLTSIMNEYKLTLDNLDIENPKSQIGQMAQQIFIKNQIFDNCNVPYFSMTQKVVCKHKQIRNVGSIASSIVYGQDLEKTATRIQELGKKLANASDLKESQDIGNAINLELAQFQMSKAKVEMMEKMNIAKSKADQDRLNQEKAKNIGKAVDTSNW